jgi:hypothetical protein
MDSGAILLLVLEIIETVWDVVNVESVAEVKGASDNVMTEELKLESEAVLMVPVSASSVPITVLPVSRMTSNDDETPTREDVVGIVDVDSALVSRLKLLIIVGADEE